LIEINTDIDKLQYVRHGSTLRTEDKEDTVMINTDIDAAQRVRHSSTLRTEDKEDKDQHRLRRIPTRQIQLNTQDRG
jgi:hypothetical protein